MTLRVLIQIDRRGEALADLTRFMRPAMKAGILLAFKIKFADDLRQRGTDAPCIADRNSFAGS